MCPPPPAAPQVPRHLRLGTQVCAPARGGAAVKLVRDNIVKNDVSEGPPCRNHCKIMIIEMESRRSEAGDTSLNTASHFLLDSDSDTLITTLETLLCAKERKVSDLITRSTTLLE